MKYEIKEEIGKEEETTKFYLVKEDDEIVLKADASGYSGWNILSISKRGLKRYQGISKTEICLDGDRKILVIN